jgi:diguanylate cyclase (GGDEF)-like protein
LKITRFNSLSLKLAALPEPVRIGVGLGLGFAVTLGMVILVMIVGFIYLSKIQSDLQQITQVNNVKTELAHTMKYAQRDRSMSLYALATLKDAFDKDEELRRFDSKGAEWWRAWEKFQAMTMNPDEVVLAGHINTLALERNSVMLDTVDMAVKKHGQAVLAHISKVVIPAQQSLSDNIDQLLILQQLQSKQAVQGAEAAYTKAREILLWLCSLTIVMGMLVATIVLRHVMRQSRELEQKALFDDLTGLPNRSLFFDRLAQAAAAYESEQKPFSVVLVDLDRFKEVNDTQGHHVGDLLLKYVAQNISAAMRRTDTVARLGGDEFVLLLPSATAENADVIVKKLVDELHTRASLDGNIVDVAASMGIACCPEHETDITRLMLKADIAMYAAKRENLGYRTYSPEIEAVAARNVELQNELRYAIDHEQLTLHYQPKISHKTGCIMGVEALVRWNHPAHGMIPPDEFIPLAEACGLIQPLALWVLKAAAQQLARWHEAGRLIAVSVNLSTRNLLDGDLPVKVVKILAEYQIKPEYLVFEITESAVMSEPARALETLKKINNLGIQLSLDDFGTGYSSLAYLKKLPVDEIKIDKSFVKDMERDSSDTVIVRSIIALGHNLGMKVVAEGVENEAIWVLLTQLGCDVSQGYFMSRPLSVAALDEWMNVSPWAKEKENFSANYPAIERRQTMPGDANKD